MSQIAGRVPGLVASALALSCATPAYPANSHDADRSHYLAPRAIETPIIDGVADDQAWPQAKWRALDNIWLGPELSDADFSGRYKVVWTQSKIFLLVEFVDDVLIDT